MLRIHKNLPWITGSMRPRNLKDKIYMAVDLVAHDYENLHPTNFCDDPSSSSNYLDPIDDLIAEPA